jgi:hypothetical protein
MPLGQHEIAGMAGAIYVLQPVLHVDVVLPRELRSGMGGMHSDAAAASHTQQLPVWSSERVCGPGYIITILGNFQHVCSLPAVRAWLLHHPIPAIQSLGREAVAVVPTGDTCIQLHIDH